MSSLEEKINSVQLSRPVSVQVHAFAYEDVGLGRRYYIVSRSQGACPYILIQPEQERPIALGENELCLKNGAPEGERWPTDKAYALIRGHDYLKFLLDGLLRDKVEDYSAIYSKALPCTPALPISREEILKNFTAEELQEILRRFICDNYIYDQRLQFAAECQLLRFSSHSNYGALMPYRPHGIFIKNTKAGVSRIFGRIGRKVEGATQKSLQGIATMDATRPSPLTDENRIFTFDEFMQFEPNQMPPIFSYMEEGHASYIKAGSAVGPRGVATINFATNPLEFERVSGTKLTDFMQEYHQTFTMAVAHLTSNFRAGFSRFGLVLFNSELKPAARMVPEALLEDEALSKVRLIADAALTHAEPLLTALFSEREVRAWLEQSIPDYDAALDEMLKRGGANQEITTIFTGQKDAYRHIRGAALLRACYLNFHVVLEGSAKTEVLLDEAEEILSEVVRFNLNSLDHVLAISRQITRPQQLELAFRTMQLDYALALLLPLFIAAHGQEQVLTKEQLKRIFEGIPAAVRLAWVGAKKYAYWSDIEPKFSQARALKRLEDALGPFGIRINPASCEFYMPGEEGRELLKETWKLVKVVKQVNIDDNLLSSLLTTSPQSSPVLTKLTSSPAPMGLFTVRILQSIPKYVAADGQQLGPFEPGQVVDLPAVEAELLIRRGIAAREAPGNG